MKISLKLSALFIYTIIFILNPAISFSQQGQTKIRGKITDRVTGEPLMFVNVVFPGKNVGVITDDKGEYFIETRQAGDSLMASFLGYQKLTKVVRKGRYQVINFELQADEYTLEAVVINAGENPAHRIFRNIIKNKDKNNPKEQDSYKQEVYNKIEFDVNNIDEEYKNKRVFKHFQFIFDYIDTSAVNGKNYLPIFISETLSEVYYQNSPERKKEVIKANKISGVENSSISQYTGQMYIDINIYNNFIGIFGKQFVSPVSDFGLLTYKYYLLDSAFIDNQWCYQLSFKPRRKQELTFIGEMWIHDTTFAVKKIKAKIRDDANINYINDVVVEHEYEYIDNKTWFLKKDEVFIDFNISDKTTGFFGRKTTSYRNTELNPKIEEGFISNKVAEETVTMEDAMQKDTAFWRTARHEKLSVKEQQIYSMVDSVKAVPMFNNIIDVITLFVSGYWSLGDIEIGPYYTLSSFNEIEGYRIRLGGRTTNDFSTKIMYSGHLAYGFKDEKLKYGIGAQYMFSKSPRRTVAFYYKDDIEQLGQSQNAFMEDNILSSMLKRNPKYKLSMVEEIKGYYEHERFAGFSNTIKFSHRRINSSDSIRFKNEITNENYDRLITSEITFNTRFAYNEKYISGEFFRKSIGSVYPIVSLDFIYGFKNVLGSDYDYLKTELNIKHHFNINPLGRLNYTIQAGKIWGELPYPLLRLHEGNETYAFDEYSFNMMNYYEFASDQYASLYLEHHFQGLFLNKIPLFRKLKWREVIYAKGLIGSLTDKNKPGRNERTMEFPYSLTVDFDKPYYEAGVGLENIFKIFRIDAIWRLSYLDHEDIEKWGIRAKLQIIF